MNAQLHHPDGADPHDRMAMSHRGHPPESLAPQPVEYRDGPGHGKRQFRLRLAAWAQVVVATLVCPDLSSSSKASAGVLHPSVLRGRLLSVAAPAARASAL